MVPEDSIVKSEETKVTPASVCPEGTVEVTVPVETNATKVVSATKSINVNKTVKEVKKAVDHLVAKPVKFKKELVKK